MTNRRCAHASVNGKQIYEFKGNMPSADYISPFPFRRFTQKDADDLLFRLMVAEGVSRWKRNAAYVAVRSAGWTYWNF